MSRFIFSLVPNIGPKGAMRPLATVANHCILWEMRRQPLQRKCLKFFGSEREFERHPDLTCFGAKRTSGYTRQFERQRLDEDSGTVSEPVTTRTPASDISLMKR